MAYVVGLIATDGCLISGRRQIAFVSMDRALCADLLSLLGRTNRIRATPTATGRTVYRVQFGDARLYRWLQMIGLEPRKSLTLGGIDVPEQHLIDLVAGLLDGDGSIEHYWYDGTGKARGGRYEALRTRFSSASEAHVAWLRARLLSALGIHGWIVRTPPTVQRREFFQLGYATRESATLLTAIYRDPAAPRLQRKRAIWSSYAQGRALVG